MTIKGTLGSLVFKRTLKLCVCRSGPLLSNILAFFVPAAISASTSTLHNNAFVFPSGISSGNDPPWWPSSFFVSSLAGFRAQPRARSSHLWPAIAPFNFHCLRVWVGFSLMNKTTPFFLASTVVWCLQISLWGFYLPIGRSRLGSRMLYLFHFLSSAYYPQIKKPHNRYWTSSGK